MNSPKGQRLQRPEIEYRWSQAFHHIRSSLTKDDGFLKWLREDAGLNAAAHLDGLWDDDPNHHVHRMASELGQAEHTLGLIVAFYVPETKSFRFAFPRESEMYRKTRTLFPTTLHQNADWFPNCQVRNHKHIQLKFSCAPAPRFSSTDTPPPVRSMMFGAYLNGDPLYCGAVEKLDTDNPNAIHCTKKGVRFRSIDTTAHLSWGLASVLYVPVHYSDERTPADEQEGLCLCFYSPLRNLFGDTGADPFQEWKPPRWLENFREKIVPHVLYRAIVDIDMAAHHAASAGLRYAYAQIETLITDCINEVKRLESEGASQSSIEGAIRSLQAKATDGHLDLLSTVGQALETATTHALSQDEIALLLDFLFYEIEETMHRRSVQRKAQSLVDDWRVTFDHGPTSASEDIDELINENPFLRRLAAVLTALLHNCIRHGSDEGFPNATVEHGPDPDHPNHYCISMRNFCDYDDARLNRYWTVKEGLLPPGRDYRRGEGSSNGMQLYLIQMMEHAGAVHVEHVLEPPSRNIPFARWDSRIVVPMRNSGSSSHG